MFESILTLAFLLQALRISVPYVLPALGATFSERSGVVNIALEGILLVSAFATTVGTFYTNNPFIGVLCGISSGVLFAGIHAIATVTCKVDQIVTGIALNLFAIGFTKFACQIMFNSSSNSPRIVGIEEWSSLFNSIAVLSLFLSNPFIMIAGISVIISHITIFKTRFGLRLRAVGEHPEAACSLGINVARIRYAAVLLSGALAGIGGAWLALDQHSFTDGMSAGRGYIALAAMIVGKWKPLNIALACLLFGLAETFVIQFQGGWLPVQFIQMLPYVLTMIVLASFIGRAIPPAALSIPYEKETH